jgi:hypothetical protein
MTIDRAKELLSNYNEKYIFWKIKETGNIYFDTVEIYLYDNHGGYMLHTIDKDEFDLMPEEEFVNRIIPITKSTKDELAEKLMTKILDREEKYQEITKLDCEIKEITQEILRRR